MRCIFYQYNDPRNRPTKPPNQLLRYPGRALAEELDLTQRNRNDGDINKPRHEKTLSSGFQTRSDTNRAVQSQKMVSGLKFWIEQVEGLYYLCSENNGADQLCGYPRPTFRRCRMSYLPVLLYIRLH